MWTVYMYKFPNNKIYIGRTKDWKARVRTGYGNTFVGKAISEFGWDNVEKIVLDVVGTVEEADRLERYYIQKYKSLDLEYGYNMTIGGSGGGVIGKYKKPMSEEAKRKSGERLREYNKTRVITDEYRRKLSESHMGHVVSDETRQKLREANLGKHHSEETRKKISQSSRSSEPDVRAKMSKALKLSGKYRAEKRRATMEERYTEGTHIKQSAESNRKRSETMSGVKKSEIAKQHMRKPKSPEHIEHMREAQRKVAEMRKRAKDLGMTYAEYKKFIETNG